MEAMMLSFGIKNVRSGVRQFQVHHKGDVILDLSVILFSFIRENVRIIFHILNIYV